MSDKELIARGAEVVTGDLILNRKVVGHYRNGQFLITPEGAHELENVVDVVAKEVPPVKPPKGAKGAKAAAVAEEVPAAPSVETLDDLLKD